LMIKLLNLKIKVTEKIGYIFTILYD